MEREDLKELLKKAFIEGNSLYKNSNITVDDWLDLFLNQYELNHPYDYKSIGLEGGGSATFTGEPSKKDIEAVNALANAARKKFKLPESTATVSDWKERFCQFSFEQGSASRISNAQLKWIEENVIAPLQQAPKEVREVYLPVEAVDGKFPELEEFYICLLESEGGAVYEEKCWWNGKYFSYPSANYSITVTHWLKKVSLSLPKGECYEAIEIKDEKDLPNETDAYICILEKKEHGVRTEIASLMEYRTAYGQFHDNNDGFKVKKWFKPISLPIKEIEGKLLSHEDGEQEFERQIIAIENDETIPDEVKGDIIKSIIEDHKKTF